MVLIDLFNKFDKDYLGLNVVNNKYFIWYNQKAGYKRKKLDEALSYLDRLLFNNVKSFTKEYHFLNDEEVERILVDNEDNAEELIDKELEFEEVWLELDKVLDLKETILYLMTEELEIEDYVVYRFNVEYNNGSKEVIYLELMNTYY